MLRYQLSVFHMMVFMDTEIFIQDQIKPLQVYIHTRYLAV